MPCKSGILPTIDLTKWADYGQEYAPHQYVIKKKKIKFNLISILTLIFYLQNILNEIPNTVVSFK